MLFSIKNTLLILTTVFIFVLSTTVKASEGTWSFVEIKMESEVTYIEGAKQIGISEMVDGIFTHSSKYYNSDGTFGYESSFETKQSTYESEIASFEHYIHENTEGISDCYGGDNQAITCKIIYLKGEYILKSDSEGSFINTQTMIWYSDNNETNRRSNTRTYTITKLNDSDTSTTTSTPTTSTEYATYENCDKNWQKIINAPGTGLFGIDWSNEQQQFIAVGHQGTIISSQGGINWQQQESGITTEWLQDIAWNGSSWVAVGSSGIVTNSSDGISWQKQTLSLDTNSSIGTYQPTLDAIDSTSKKWIVVGHLFNGENSDGIIISSSDGLNWSKVFSLSSTATELGSVYLKDIRWNGTQWVAVGHDYGTEKGVILSSNDGISWSLSEMQSDWKLLEDVAWNGSQWIASGSSTLISSTDGINWTSINSGLGWYSNISWTGSHWIGNNGGIVYASTDGLTWNRVNTSNSHQIRAISFNGYNLVIVGLDSTNEYEKNIIIMNQYESASLDMTASKQLHINQVRAFDAEGQYIDYNNVALNILEGITPLSFTLAYLEQPNNKDFCELAISTLSIDGKANIPLVQYTDLSGNITYYNNVNLEVKSDGRIELISATPNK